MDERGGERDREIERDNDEVEYIDGIKYRV
jgi:hypothetical protein